MINKQKIYVAGPYSTGDVMLNIRDAVEVANYLLDYGFIPFVPHLTGFWHMLYSRKYEDWLQYDEEWLKSCDAVLRLSGESYGADREVNLAKELGIPVFLDTSDLTKYFMEHN